jgi:MscS family membrane protein
MDKQITLITKSMDKNLTREQINALIQLRETHYQQAIEFILLNKHILQDLGKEYSTKVFHLKKIIAINKEHNNSQHVIQEEIQLKSYQLLHIQNDMLQKIFRALASDNIETFEKKMHEIFIKSQKKINALGEQDSSYRAILASTTDKPVVREIKQTIKEYFAIKEINADILRYFSNDQERIYRLYKYDRYHILKPILYADHLEKGNAFNKVLASYGLSIGKLLLMLLVTLVIFFIRKVLLNIIEKVLLRSKYIGQYTQAVMNDIRTPIAGLLILINIHLVIYIFHNLSTNVEWSRFFNILYTLFSTYILYRLLNSIASIKMEKMTHSKRKVKDELLNITVKILNFIILILGILVALHFTGLNLTAILSGLGIGGFAVALAARESLANFFGTLSILMSNIYSQGDWINVDGKEGHVVEIGLRVTTIRTFDNALIAIPNATIASADVRNWSRRVVGRRIKMTLSLKYSSKREDLKNAIDEIRVMLKEHPGIATDKTKYQDRDKKSAKLVSKEDELGVKRTLLVYLDALSDSSIDILVYTFTKSTVWSEWLATKEDVILKIMEIIEKNHLEFAFKTITIDHETDKE